MVVQARVVCGMLGVARVRKAVGVRWCSEGLDTRVGVGGGVGGIKAVGSRGGGGAGR